jgi:hypothetical protein
MFSGDDQRRHMKIGDLPLRPIGQCRPDQGLYRSNPGGDDRFGHGSQGVPQPCHRGGTDAVDGGGAADRVSMAATRQIEQDWRPTDERGSW